MTGAIARLLSTLALLAVGLSSPLLAQVLPRPGQLTAGSIDVGGVARTYLLYVPSGYRTGTPLPLVFAFHGGGGFANDMAAASGLTRQSEPQNFIAVYPQGIAETWNTEASDGTFVERSSADDVAFVRALLQRMQLLLSIDPGRVYAAGFSKGGMFAYTVGCRLPGVFAALASVSGPMVTTACTPAAPVSVLHIHGTADQNVPFTGGRGLLTDPRNSWPAAGDGLSAWGRSARCDATATASAGLAPNWTCSAFAHCSGGDAVTWCLVQGGAHEWPAPAGVVIAAFFRQHAN